MHGIPILVKDEIDVAVPELTMKDVGHGTGAKNGAAIKDVAMQVMTAGSGASGSCG